MIIRVLVTGALSLPLALGVAGIASADTGGDTTGPTLQLAAQSQGEPTNEDRGVKLDLNLDGLSDNNRGDDDGLFDGGLVDLDLDNLLDLDDLLNTDNQDNQDNQDEDILDIVL